MLTVVAGFSIFVVPRTPAGADVERFIQHRPSPPPAAKSSTWESHVIHLDVSLVRSPKNRDVDDFLKAFRNAYDKCPIFEFTHSLTSSFRHLP